RAEHLIERARATYQVAMRVNSGEELPVVLKLATEHLARALNASSGTAMLLAADGVELQPVGSLSPDMQEHFSALNIALDTLPNFWLAIHTGKALLVTPELAQEQEIEWFHRFRSEEHTSELQSLAYLV